MSLDVIAIGDSNVDLIVTVKGFPVRGGNAYVDSFEKIAGGTAGNFAVAASRLGLRTGLVSKIGNDEYGRFFKADLEMEGVDISHLLTDKKAHTGWVFVVVDAQGERTFFAFRTNCADSLLRYEEIDMSYLRRARLIHVSGILLTASESRKTILKVMEELKAAVSYTHLTLPTN